MDNNPSHYYKDDSKTIQQSQKLLGTQSFCQQATLNIVFLHFKCGPASLEPSY